MQRWNDRAPFGPGAFVDRIRMRRAALRYAQHGWTVIPGACLSGRRFVCDRAGCPTTGCHPALDSWEESATADAGRVLDWWRRRPHTVLLATGVTFDVIEVPEGLGLRVLGAIRLQTGVTGPAGGTATPGGDARGPVAVAPGGRWMFFVRPGGESLPTLARCPGVVHHGPGSWVPAVPTRLPEGRVQWAVPPEPAGWRLPEAATVQDMLVDALGTGGRAGLRLPRSVPATGRAA